MVFGGEGSAPTACPRGPRGASEGERRATRAAAAESLDVSLLLMLTEPSFLTWIFCDLNAEMRSFDRAPAASCARVPRGADVVKESGVTSIELGSYGVLRRRSREGELCESRFETEKAVESLARVFGARWRVQLPGSNLCRQAKRGEGPHHMGAARYVDRRELDELACACLVHVHE